MIYTFDDTIIRIINSTRKRVIVLREYAMAQRF